MYQHIHFTHLNCICVKDFCACISKYICRYLNASKCRYCKIFHYINENIFHDHYDDQTCTVEEPPRDICLCKSN